MEKEKAIRTLEKIWSIKTVISNILWFFLGGLWLGLIFASLGVALCLTIIGFPAGRICYRYSFVAMFPYGKKVEIHSGKHLIGNLFWAIFVGWWFSLLFIVTGVLWIMTVIGFFRGLQALKLSRLAFFPFVAKITDSLKEGTFSS